MSRRYGHFLDFESFSKFCLKKAGTGFLGSNLLPTMQLKPLVWIVQCILCSNVKSTFQNFLFQRRTAPIPRIVFVPIQLKSNSIKFHFGLNGVQLNSVASIITRKLKTKVLLKASFRFRILLLKETLFPIVLIILLN